MSLLSYLNSRKALKSTQNRNIELNQISASEKKSSLLNHLQEAQVCSQKAKVQIRNTEINIACIEKIMSELFPEKKDEIQVSRNNLNSQKEFLDNLEEKIKAEYNAIKEMNINENPNTYEQKSPEITLLKNESKFRMDLAESLCESIEKAYGDILEKSSLLRTEKFSNKPINRPENTSVQN